MAQEITEQDFEQSVLKASRPVLVDFYATWCSPCVQQAPILEKWAKANQDKVDVVKVNVDNSSNLASQYRVMSIPTLLLFTGGQERARGVGLQNEKALDGMLAKAGGE